MEAMLEDDDIVTDSLGCEIEEHQPLGNLLEIFSLKSGNDADQASRGDSDETCLDASSCEFEMQNEFHQVDIADDDTCMSSNWETSPLMPSQVSLFSTERNNSSLSVEKSVAIMGSGNVTAKENITTSNTCVSSTLSNSYENFKSFVSQPTELVSIAQRRKRRRRKKTNWSTVSQNYGAGPSVSKAPQRKSYPKAHCFHMEEINVIESKLSSVEKLLSTKMRQCVEQAHIMMKEEVIERIEKIKKIENDKYYDTCSSERDSDEEQEVSRLIEVKKNRLNSVVVHQKIVMQKLQEELSKPVEDESLEESEVSPSQSVLPPTFSRKNLTQMSKPYNLRKIRNKKTLVKMSEIMQLPNLESNKSVIYIPIISGKNTKCAKSPMTSLPVATSPNIMYMKKVTVTTPMIVNIGSIGVLSQLKEHAKRSKSTPSTSVKAPAVSRLPSPDSQPSAIASKPLFRMPHAQIKPSAESLKSEQNQSQPITSPVGYSELEFERSQSESTVHANTQSQSSTLRRPIEPVSCLDLCEMLKIGLLSRGTNVLSFSSEINNAFHLASLVGSGLILSPDHQIYVSPMTWLKAITSKYYPRVSAYKKIFYQGTSLFDLSCSSSTSSIKTNSRNQITHAFRKAISTIDPFTFESSNARVSGFAQSDHLDASRSCNAVQHSSETVQCLPGREQLSGTSAKSVFPNIRHCKIRLVQDDEFFLPSSLFWNNPWPEDKISWHLLNDGW